MAKLTRCNIALNLHESPYYLDVSYTHNTLRFVFSSELYKSKFYDRFIDNREKINQSLSNRFGFTINNDLLCDLKLYITIEKRGFLILEEGKEWSNINDIILDGQKMITKS